MDKLWWDYEIVLSLLILQKANLCSLWLSKESGKCVAMKKVQVLFLSIVVIQKLRHSLGPLCPLQIALLVLVSNDKTTGGQRLHARPPFAEIQHLFAFHTCFLGIYLAISYMFSALFIFFYIHHNVHKLAISSVYH